MKSKCEVKTCNKPAHVRGLCGSHLKGKAMRICSIENCTNKHAARGWCHKHYQRYRSHGNPTVVLDNRQPIIPAKQPFTSWADVPSLNEAVSTGEFGMIKGLARSDAATTYLDGTDMTVEQVVNGVRCPTCGSDATYRCMYPAHGEPVARSKNKPHEARVQAAIERFETQDRTG